jgi:hypothetical protein
MRQRSDRTIRYHFFAQMLEKFGKNGIVWPFEGPIV